MLIGNFSKYSYIVNFLSLTIIPILISEKLFNRQLNLNFKCKKIKLTLTVIFITVIAYISAYLFIKGTNFKFPENIIKIIIFQLFYIAIPEEIFFRGILLGNIKKENRNPISKENLFTSILFSIAHILIYKNPIMLKVIFPSLIFGFLFEKTNSLCAPIVTHLIYNIIYSAMFLL